MDLSRIIAFGPPKEAALYFERVFPLDLGESLLGQRRAHSDLYIPFTGGVFDRSVVNSLLGDENSEEIYASITNTSLIYQISNTLQSEEGRASFWSDPNARNASRIFREVLGVDFDKMARDIEGGRFDPDTLLVSVSLQFEKIIEKSKFNGCASWNFLSAEDERVASERDANTFCASLNGLRLVDPAKVSWEKLTEFRRDKECFSALRDLRVFFQTEYDGKERHFIQDDLSSKIEKYEQATKIWDMETVQRSLSVLFNEKSVLATSVGSVATHWVGGSLLTAAGAGAVIGFGSATLELGRIYIDRQKERIDSPIRYLSNIKKVFAK